jgi:hypothetical protein
MTAIYILKKLMEEITENSWNRKHALSNYHQNSSVPKANYNNFPKTTQ